jgi:preprotein translocase subunit SecG
MAKTTYRQQVQQTGRGTYQTVVTGRGTSGRTYHRIVLAEFMVCVVLVGMSPVLTARGSGAGAAAQDAGNAAAELSLAAPLVRLTAVCIVFFVLALMATGNQAGKVAAAFGGLVVLGTLLNATDELSVLAKSLTGWDKKAAAAAPAKGGGG